MEPPPPGYGTQLAEHADLGDPELVKIYQKGAQCRDGRGKCKNVGSKLGSAVVVEYLSLVDTIWNYLVLAVATLCCLVLFAGPDLLLFVTICSMFNIPE